MTNVFFHNPVSVFLRAGTYSTIINATSAMVCQTCAFGLFSVMPASNTSALCLPCIPGIAIGLEYYSAAYDNLYFEGSLWYVLSLCLSGTYYQDIPGSGPTCVACIPGTYSTAIGATSDSTCLACPGGSFSSLIGAASLEQCRLCPAGKI